MAISIGPQNGVDPLRNTVRPDSKVDANDFKHFSALRKSARADDPSALREVARQFESIFTKMMLDGMRKASFGDPLFGSDQADMYQDMMDDQLSVEMSQGKGLGLADLLIKQLSHGANMKSPDELAVPGAEKALPITDDTKQKFIETIMPQAQTAGRELGVDPRAIVAQAALETGWGTSKPADAAGGSNNLFGIKAGGRWQGASVSSSTQEYTGGVANDEVARFRAYASESDSIKDYVALLRDNPRYSEALNTGGDVRAFATALQRGGYATDPDYANKLVSVAEQLGMRQPIAGPIEASLKTNAPKPITEQS
ncbi:MAG: glucosaminidase domain-containing protein [Pseudomonadota bacterium]